MGAKHSSDNERSNYNISEEEVKKIIEQQKKIFEANYVKLLNTTKGADEAFLAEQTREEARKEVERILKEREANNTNSASTSGVLERQRAPYSLSRSALPSQSNSNIYPTLTNNQQSSPFLNPNVNNPTSQTSFHNQPPNYYAAPNQPAPANVQYNHTFGPHYPSAGHSNAYPNTAGSFNPVNAHLPSAPTVCNSKPTGNNNFCVLNKASNPLTDNSNQTGDNKTRSPNTLSKPTVGTSNQPGNNNTRSPNTSTNPTIGNSKQTGNNNIPSPNISTNSTNGNYNQTANINTRSLNTSFNPTTGNFNQANAKINYTVNAKQADENNRFADHPVRSNPRDRSASRNRNRNRKAQKDDELNCRTCYSNFTAKIYQCSQGHSSCSNCRARLAKCGICSNFITDIRNRALEEFISERKIPCTNAHDGCRLYIKISELEIHTKECPFQEMKCPLADIFGQCQWRGKLPQLASHFDDVHSMHRQGTVDTELYLLNLKNDHQVVYLVTIGNFNFLFNLKVDTNNRTLYMAVQLMGTIHSAEKWNYEIHVYNKNKPRKKFQYVDVCRSDKVSLRQVLDEGDCAMLPLSYAENFVHEGKFTYKFYIKRENAQGEARRTN